MARGLRRIVSIVLSAALAAPIPASAARVVVQGALSAPAVRAIPALPAAPSALTAAPLPLSAGLPIAAPAGSATPSAEIAAKTLAAAPALSALAEPKAGASASLAAGRELEDVITGARSARGSEIADAVSAVPALRLSAALAAPSASERPAAAVPAAPAVAPASASKSVSTARSYAFHRRGLSFIARMTGAVYTLPQAGPALTEKIIASAAGKTLVISDYDDTLAAYNEVLPAEMIEAIRKLRAAGKHFVVISDRGDEKRPNSNQLTVFESLASLPVDVRAGMYVAANSGGKVYRYDEHGVPQKVESAAALEGGKHEIVEEAAAATKARLAEVGAVQHVADGKNPAESYNTYGYAMMLQAGSSESAVRGAAAILAEELASRGIQTEVNPRFAKDPANPPYITFSIINKSWATGYIANALGVKAEDALVIGDSMFVPREPKSENWLTRLGERLSGAMRAKTGNETDRNMANGLPGVLALGVGANMDPRVPNGWTLDGKGPAVTRRVLESVASRPARQRASLEEPLMMAAILAAAAFSWYVIGLVLSAPLSGGNHYVPGMELMGVGGMVRSIKGKKPKLTDDQVRSRVSSVVHQKGLPYSEQDYNIARAFAVNALEKDGASKKQIALFEKLCAEAPIKGGRFSSYIGD